MPVENITDLTMSDVCNLAICLNCPDSTGYHTKSHQVFLGNVIIFSFSFSHCSRLAHFGSGSHRLGPLGRVQPVRLGHR